MTLDDVRFDINIINECIEEMSQPITDRGEFLNKNIANRLDKINKIYAKEFDIKLVELETIISSPSTDMITLSKAVRKFSKISNSVYSVALELIDVM